MLLLLMFYAYNITSFNYAEDVTVPPADAPVVIQNEPQIVPDRQPGDTAAAPDQTPTQAASGTTEIFS